MTSGDAPNSIIITVAARINPAQNESTVVPEPNNLVYPLPGGGGKTYETSFIEFPSFPRIAMHTGSITTRGNHPPAWENSDGERAGTTGVYAEIDGTLVTGASLLGATNETFAFLYDVPTTNSDDTGIKFDVFPGAAAITDNEVIAFKGNFQIDKVAKTGVFFRQLTNKKWGGAVNDAHFVASSDSAIPNPALCRNTTTFGSTAPPSAAGNTMVFVGLDNEDDPSCGGIYQASFVSNPTLNVLVSLGETLVPGLPEPLTRLGEGLSYDESLLAFWGAWGTETKTIRLYCRTTGNQDRRDFCNHVGNFTGGLGDPKSTCIDANDVVIYPCYQEKEVPVNQGIFVLDLANNIGNNVLYLIARVGDGGSFDDFV
jgi:hypothetical protein